MKKLILLLCLITPVTAFCTALIVGSIAGNQTICSGEFPAILTGTPPSNGTEPTYQWQSSPNNSTWTDIPGATNLNYQPWFLTDTVYYRQQQNATGVTGGPLPTNTVTITVMPMTIVSVLQDDTITGRECYTSVDTLIVAGDTTTWVVDSLATVTIMPGSNVFFKPGFKVELGGNLRVYFIHNWISKVNGVTIDDIGKVNGIEKDWIRRLNEVSHY